MGADRSLYWIRNTKLAELQSSSVQCDLDWIEVLIKLRKEARHCGMIASARLGWLGHLHAKLVKLKTEMQNDSTKNLIQIIELLEKREFKLKGQLYFLEENPENFILDLDTSNRIRELALNTSVSTALMGIIREMEFDEIRYHENKVYELVYGLSMVANRDRHIVSSVFF